MNTIPPIFQMVCIRKINKIRLYFNHAYKNSHTLFLSFTLVSNNQYIGFDDNIIQKWEFLHEHFRYSGRFLQQLMHHNNLYD